MNRSEANMRAKKSEKLISEINKKAEKAGLSYGKYVAQRETNNLHKMYSATKYAIGENVEKKSIQSN